MATRLVTAVVTVAVSLAAATAPAAAQRVPPSPRQLSLQKAVRATQFVHFSVCTFVGCEQDIGPGPASAFAPTATVDPGQWVAVAKSWGADQLCLTAHHSGGFALWQTNATEYGVRQSPYLNGTADIVRDFVAACRLGGVSPCLYFIPAWDTFEKRDTPELYLARQLQMLRELLTRYGHIDRLWIDFYAMGCGQYGAECPPGSFGRGPNAAGWANVSALLREVSPKTAVLPGPDGCLSDAAVENGVSAYPSWYTTNGAITPQNPVMCASVPPNASGTIVYQAHEVDHTIQNPGDHWFWRADHPYLTAAGLFQHWLDTVGQGAIYNLNVPPDTTGSIPANFTREIALLGAAINGSFGTSVASATAVPATLPCDGSAGSAVTLTLPAGVAIDALAAVEDLTDGQAIAQYRVQVQRKAGGPWAVVEGVHGQTVGTAVIDVLPAAVVGPAVLRWTCLAATPSGATARLAAWTAHALQPPPGWAPPKPTKWALQTLYSPVAEDMTPCATRDTGVGAEKANRSACRAYMNKPGAKFTYIRDEHCCFGPGTREATVPLYLLYSSVNQDHLVASNASFSRGGAEYTHDSTECWALPAPAAGAAPLDMYWSEARRDTWSLASNASRAQAAALGYVYTGTTAYVPTEC